MREFRSGSSRVLITTDVLARGIDVQQVTLVSTMTFPPTARTTSTASGPAPASSRRRGWGPCRWSAGRRRCARSSRSRRTQIVVDAHERRRSHLRWRRNRLLQERGGLSAPPGTPQKARGTLQPEERVRSENGTGPSARTRAGTRAARRPPPSRAGRPGARTGSKGSATTSPSASTRTSSVCVLRVVRLRATHGARAAETRSVADPSSKSAVIVRGRGVPAFVHATGGAAARMWRDLRTHASGREKARVETGLSHPGGVRHRATPS